MKPTIFTVNLFNPLHLKDRDLFISSWEEQMPDYDIKVYTENDQIVQEALEKGKEWIDYCKQLYLYNYATNYIRLYILGKMPNHLYLDDDVYVYKNIFENIDLSTTYISFRNGYNYDGILSAIYNGNNVLDVDDTLRFMNDSTRRLDNLDNDYIVHNLDDGCIVRKLMIDNSFRIFPQNLFFHYNSLFPCIKTKNIKIVFENIDVFNEQKYSLYYDADTSVVFVEDNVEPYTDLKLYYLPNNIFIIGVYKYNDDVYTHILYILKRYKDKITF